MSYMRALLLTLTIFSLGLNSCTKSEPESGLTEITIDQAELILSAETDADIAQPSTIRVATYGFYLYDFGLQKILFYDKEGKQQLQFGQEGQGPGEFQGLGGFWVFDDSVVGFDQRGAKFLYYSHDGELMREQQIEQEHFAPGLSMITADRFYIPLNGNGGKLAKYIDISSGESFSFGEAAFEEADFDPGTIQQSIERGNLPDYMLNRVSISANQNRIFLFHTATGKLQAFDKNGDLLSETTLEMPVLEKIKEEFFEHSKMALEQGFFILFSYINSMVSTENGVALLLNGPAEHPVTVLHLDNNLESKTAYYYDSEDFGRVSRFDIDEKLNSIYFVNPGTSEIFRAPWGL